MSRHYINKKGEKSLLRLSLPCFLYVCRGYAVMPCRLLLLFVVVYVEVPTQVVFYGILQYVYHICAHQGYMMLKAMPANKLHELLQMVYVCYGNASVHAVGIVGDVSIAQICAYLSGRIVG